MKKSIVICFIKGAIFSKGESFHSVYTLRETDTGRELTDILELHYLELGKISWRGRSPAELTPLERFGVYLRCSGDPEQEQYVDALVRQGGEVITMTDKMLRKISEEERIREARIDRERYELDVAWGKSIAHEKGLAEGLAQGRNEGLAQGRSEGAMLRIIQIVQKKWQRGETAEKIAEDLLEDRSTIERICELAAEDPAGSAEKLYEALRNDWGKAR